MTTSGLRLAFAGLGAMGYGMALQLLRSGFSVVGFDVYGPSTERLATEGAQIAHSPQKAVENVSFLLCMVATSEQATLLLFDPQVGAAEALLPNGTILLLSTVAPGYIRQVRKQLDDIGRTDLRLIDCPVSGGASRAADGTLSIFASGEVSDIDNVEPILQCLSSRLYRVPGGLGKGSETKLVHQIFAAIHIAMSSEAMSLAAAAGLNTQNVFDRLERSEGGSWMFENRVPPMFDLNHSRYSSLSIINKDVIIITSTSRDSAFPLPLLSTAAQLYMSAMSAGWGKEDDCVLVRVYLPGRWNLVNEMAKSTVNEQAKPEPTPVTVDDIKDLLVGVHLGAIAEAMSFCDFLGLDSDLMYDVVSNAAGSSAMFHKAFPEMRRAKWNLKGVLDIEDIRARLVTRSIVAPFFE